MLMREIVKEEGIGEDEEEEQHGKRRKEIYPRPRKLTGFESVTHPMIILSGNQSSYWTKTTN